MTFNYKNVYIKDTATICGPYEKDGPLKKYFDKSYNDLYFGEKSFEKAEIKLVKDALVMLMKKTGLKKEDIELTIGGDLLNQIAASTYGTYSVGDAFIGIYGACSTSVLGMIVGSNFIDDKRVKNACVVVSSHNMSSEKQFRNPTEYGAPKPSSATFTATGAAACLLIDKKSSVKVDCATLGKIVDYGQNDPNDMGRVMAPAVIETLLAHFKDTGRSVDDYDLILTGDLGIYGKNILMEYMQKYHDIDLSKKYNDCGVMLYDLEKQEEVNAGGSGPVCSALVNYSYVFEQLKKKKLKRVLLIATGALFSPTMVYQKENIYSIAHAISLEAV